MAEPRKRRSHVLEYLQQQAENRKAAEEEAAGQEGGDQPFPDINSILGLGKSGPESGQAEGGGQR